MRQDLSKNWSFFHFQTDPFSEESPVSPYTELRSQRNALDMLCWGIRDKKGILLLTGAEGVGKSSVLEAVQCKIGPSFRYALLKYPPVDSNGLLENLLLAFKIPIQRRNPRSLKDKLELLQEFVIGSAASGAHTVVLIDNAELLSQDSLETLRLCSNLMTEKARLLTIVLAGNDGLLEKIKKTEMRQFLQRIFVHLCIQPLSFDETDAYLKHRLSRIGSGNELRFEPKALKKLHALSSGNPRRLNQLTQRVLKMADKEAKRLITPDFVKIATKDLR